MKSTPKAVILLFTLLGVITLTGCNDPAASPEDMPDVTAEPSPPVLKTSMGEFLIGSVSVTDQVKDIEAPQGEQFLLISITYPDGTKPVAGEFSLEDFQAMINSGEGEIFVESDDGTKTMYTQMGGWLEDDFVFGYRVPLAGSYTLHWGGNDPIELDVE
jgi:hypothetical protein